jgi:serine/threonine-protein kinase RsbW/stage II sporulation protein AB (anti-sigma F factor)
MELSRGLRAGVNQSYPAEPAALPRARRAITALARTAGATGDELDAIRLAASEALTNVIVHAYRDRPGKMHVTAAVAQSELWVLVADDGDGLSQRSGKSGLGLGLTLIAQACDELTIVKRSGGGTEVRMRFGIGGAAPLGPDGHVRESSSSASSPASSIFSTTR